MKNTVLFLFVLLCSSCLTFDETEDSICVSRCLTIEGVISASSDMTPYSDLKIEASYFQPSFSLSRRDIKAKTTTDDNGFYTMSFEVFDSELNDDGHFEVEIKKTADQYWPGARITAFNVYPSELNVDSLYIADFLIPRAAFISYDIDRLNELAEDETLVLTFTYSFESITGTLTRGNYFEFNRNSDDEDLIKVPANVPINIKAEIKGENTSEVVLEEAITIASDETYDFNLKL